MLGYSTGRGISFTIRYGITELVWMSGVDCNGTEDSLAECPFDGWGQVHCTSYPSATVFCYNDTATAFDVRLSGGPGPHVGRVEVYYSGYWGTVCDYVVNYVNNWDYRAAHVTCSMLGYRTGRHIYRTTDYGDLTEPIWMAGVDCNGTEDSLADCTFDGWGRSGSCHSHPASVFCYNDTVDSPIDIRLVDGPNNYTGRVEVYYGGHCGSVCSDNFDDKDAAVVCRMLRYSDMRALSIVNGVPIEPMWMNNIKCIGTESSLVDCPFDGWGRVGLCPNQPRVTCYNVSVDSPIDIRLVDGPNHYTGRVEVYYSGHWGAVCSDSNNKLNSFSDKDAAVACRMLHYSNVRVVSKVNGVPIEPVLMDNIRCNGTESSLADCPFDGWGRVALCLYQPLVTCYNVSVDSPIDIRLVDGPNHYTGRVEVYYSGHWGAVCSDSNNKLNSFSDKDAAVACRMLHYSDVRVVSKVNGVPIEPVLMDNIRCNGTESSLADCPFDGWGRVALCLYQPLVTCYNVSVDSPIDIRLVDGPNHYTGRVEVYYSGHWGAVCSDSNNKLNSFSDKDAAVACRMLHYCNAVAVGSAYFGAGSGSIWMDDVRCDGSEQSLDECQFTDWRDQDCEHYEDAGVICLSGDQGTAIKIRLTRGPGPHVGRVEVYYSGYWGSVCRDKYWDYKDANVTCRMLGYSTGWVSHYVSVIELMWMGDVDCNGMEDSLADCDFGGWGRVDNCPDPAGVFCYNVTETHFDIRLSGGPGPHAGRVEVYYSGYWGSVCGEYKWDYRAANVTCRMLGYSTGRRTKNSYVYGDITEPVWLGGVDCNGMEDSLANCSFDGWGPGGYCGDYPAGVFCYNVTGTAIKIRLTRGPGPHVGRVEVYYSGYWGSICRDKYWDDKDANVTCRMLGYSTGHVSDYVSVVKEPMWMGDVDCNGMEDSLADCDFGGWGRVDYCPDPAGDFCYNVTETHFDIRLSGGPGPHAGRVEVYYSGYWGSVCDEYKWDYRAANVTCRMLGYSTGRRTKNEYGYGHITEPVWLGGVDCNGMEDSLANCSFDGWGRGGYCSDYPAGVFCYNVTGTAIKIRLTRGPGPHDGRVEVYYSGYWGSICHDKYWDYKDANVTCRMLGYSTGCVSQYGSVIEPMWMGDVDCNGMEDSLADCDFGGWGRVDYCLHPAGVFCYNVTESCSAFTVYNRDLERNISFGAVVAGNTAFSTEICITDRRPLANVTCRRLPIQGASYGEIKINRKCVFTNTTSSNSTATLQKLAVANVTNTTEILADTYNITRLDDLTSLDVIYTASILDNVAKSTDKFDEKSVEYAADIVNTMIGLNRDILVQAQDAGSGATRLVESLENISNNIVLDDTHSASIIRPFVASEIREFSSDTNLVVGLQLLDSTEVTITNNSLKILEDEMNLDILITDAAIILPKSLLQSANTTRLLLQIYSSTKLFSTISSNKRFMIHGNRVAAATLTQDQKRILNLTQEEVKTVFRPLKQTEGLVCGYWDYSKNDNSGDWSTDGCRLHSQEDNRAICVCNHLTNFAILIDFEAQGNYVEAHQLALSIITIVGLVLSIIGLSFTIICFVVFKPLRKTRGQKVLFQLAVAMLCSWVVFLAGVEQTSDYNGCIAVAILLHYLILVTFLWLLVEGLLQYLRFVKVLGTYIPRFMLKASIFAWGVPAIPVIIVCAIDYRLYDGGIHYCWMSLKPFYYAFALPVGLVILTNIIVFILVIVNIVRRPAGLQSNQSERKRALMNFWAALSIFVLLGVTWIFGYMAIEDARIPFQYLFTICNAFQGFVIFLLFIIRDPQVRREWTAMCCRRKKKYHTGYDSSAGSKSKDSAPLSDLSSATKNEKI